MDEPLQMTVDEAVSLALAEERERHARSGSSLPYRELVLVRGIKSLVARRPFRRKGEWCVRWAGTARLTTPTRINDVVVFGATWE